MSQTTKGNTMENPDAYIILDDSLLLSDDELALDSFDDMEYNTPYTSYSEDTLDVGGIIGDMSIFDDR